MKFYSTNNKDLRVGLKEAVIQGLADDGGLYMPIAIPTLPPSFFSQLRHHSKQSIAYEIAKIWVGSEIPDGEIEKIIEQTVFFDVPLVNIHDKIFALELFHGPTMAFKDFGARFMASLLGYFSREASVETTVLVATSGDTGSAVAHGFHNVSGVRVIVLYPSGKVSELQEKQFTTLGGNITAIEIEGTFDDCQRLVKAGFNDSELRGKLTMTSANSINIARLIPQSFYYFFAVAELDHDHPIVFSVPSGNFGNLTAGVLAKRMGLPIHRFIAATNINDVVPQYLLHDQFTPRPSMATISNAMDVGNPSNFARLMDLYHNDHGRISADIHGFSFTDAETREAMRGVSASYGYILDPHGAVGYLGLKKGLASGEQGVFLETAHPGKFREVVEEALGYTIELPDRLKALAQKQKESVRLSKEFDEFKEFLIKNN